MVNSGFAICSPLNITRTGGPKNHHVQPTKKRKEHPKVTLHKFPAFTSPPQNLACSFVAVVHYARGLSIIGLSTKSRQTYTHSIHGTGVVPYVYYLKKN